MAELWCGEARELVPEVSLGVAPGDDRARLLAHVETCDGCRTLLERTSATVDELVLLAPEQEPPLGFDGRVLRSMRPPGVRRRVAATLLAAAVLVLVALAAAGVTREAGSDDRQLAEQYRRTLEVADGRYLRAAELVTRAGVEAGHVFAYEGRPSWVFMTVEGAPDGDYAVTLVARDGRVQDLGVCRVQDGTGAWGVAVEVPIAEVAHLELRQEDTTLRASFGG